MEPVDQKMLVRYRHMYIREIDLLSHQTRAVVYPSKKAVGVQTPAGWKSGN